uniref:Histidine-rich glycoprotein n=1 Tax=Schistosoma japonicum TaxID=6182 RepID=C1L3V6_SCHJA|nr:Histidine-rich glycoprotein precursor [Schistosoma japonicum]
MMSIFYDFNIYLLLLYLTSFNSVVDSRLKDGLQKNVTIETIKQTGHNTTSTTDGNITSVVNSSTVSGVKIISAASFTYTDTSSYTDYLLKKTPPKPKKPQQPKKTDHYDSHKASYEEYFKSYDRHHPDHDHHHHHHPPPPPPPRDHYHPPRDHYSNGGNDKITIPSDWIYEKLKEYLTCIYEQQINCEDQFVTQLQLKILKMKSPPYSSEQHHLQKPIPFETEKQKPTLTFTFNKESQIKKPEKTEQKPHTKHKHDKIDEERRRTTTEHHPNTEKTFEINQHNEEEKFFTHEFHQTLIDQSSSNKDEYYHHDRHREHHHHHHVNGIDEHNDRHHPYHHRDRHHHYHVEYEHPRHDKYDWSSKMDEIIPLLKYDGDKEKHLHSSPTHRYHDKKKY